MSISPKIRIRTLAERESDERLLRRFKAWIDTRPQGERPFCDLYYYHGFVSWLHYYHILALALSSAVPRKRRAALRAIRDHLNTARAASCRPSLSDTA